jgi:hypothetical protein
LLSDPQRLVTPGWTAASDITHPTFVSLSQEFAFFRLPEGGKGANKGGKDAKKCEKKRKRYAGFGPYQRLTLKTGRKNFVGADWPPVVGSLQGFRRGS